MPLARRLRRVGLIRERRGDCKAPARLTPGAQTAAHAISDYPEAPLTTKELAPVKITLILSRIWYVVAIGVTAGLIAGASALIYVTHAPVAQFLRDVALCATAWSHGKCPLF